MRMPVPQSPLLLADEFPEEKAGLEAFADFLAKASGPELAACDLTVGQLAELLRPSEPRVLAMLLSRMVQLGILEKLIRVTDAQGQTSDYASLLDVPPVLVAGHVGQGTTVRLGQLQLIHKPARGSAPTSPGTAKIDRLPDPFNTTPVPRHA